MVFSKWVHLTFDNITERIKHFVKQADTLLISILYSLLFGMSKSTNISLFITIFYQSSLEIKSAIDLLTFKLVFWYLFFDNSQERYELQTSKFYITVNRRSERKSLCQLEKSMSFKFLLFYAYRYVHFVSN